jgi:DNA-binding MarR family transcriptional regulator
LSSDSQDKYVKGVGQLTRELRQSASLSASFFRVAATRLGIAVTDMQVIDLLDLTGPSTAGQLAELTGLTTGAITRILDRLEKAGLIRRERDKSDGRKVIVRLVESKDETHKVRSLLDSFGKVWDEVASRYDEEQITFLQGFLKQGNMLFSQKLIQLQQEAPSDEGEIFSAPLEDQENGRLVVSCGISRLSLHADERIAKLYQARFEGPVPKVSTKDGVVSIRYPRRLLGLGEKGGRAEVALNVTIPWRIVIQGGAAEFEAFLDGLDLAKLEIMGGFSLMRLDLGAPSDLVPIHINAGTSQIEVRRPVGVATRVQLTGWVSELVFDDQTWSGVGNNARLQSPGFDPTAPGYDIEVTGYSNRITITSR